MSVPNSVLDIRIDIAGDNEIEVSIIVMERRPLVNVPVLY